MLECKASLFQLMFVVKNNVMQCRKLYSRIKKNQKTREGCGCFRGLFGGSPGKLRESPGKIAGIFFPDREMLQILGFRAGRPAANLGSTLPRPCPHLPCGVFFEIDSSSLLEFF